MMVIMKHYKAIIFDLFGTLVDFDVTLLPPLKLNEEEIYCTTVPLFETASKIHHSGSLEAFHNTLQAVIQRSRDEKKISLKEISCLTRMRTLLEHLRFPENEETRELAVRMKDLHMGLMKKCVFLPGGHLPLLERLKPGFKLGVLSNFDDADTGYRILDELEINHFFESILFSEEAGWIKPNPDLYKVMLRKMNVRPEETLFVGDTPEADIFGPKQYGMDTAWINPEGFPFPGDHIKPDYELRHLSELESIVSANRLTRDFRTCLSDAGRDTPTKHQHKD
jgi:FMN phosphatase YigB (HAD superfamily)